MPMKRNIVTLDHAVDQEQDRIEYQDGGRGQTDNPDQIANRSKTPYASIDVRID